MSKFLRLCTCGAAFATLLMGQAGSAAAPAQSPPRAQSNPRRVTPAGGRAVLVVDDEEVVRAAAGAALRTAGYTVIEAADGQEAVDLFRVHAGRIAAVLLDMAMPVVAGAEAIPLLRAIRADVPIIASSGYGELNAAARFAGEGVEGFLQKPYASERLLEVMAAVLAAD